MKRVLFLLFIVLTFELSAMSLDEQIANVQKASPEKRFELMNALKQRISTMNANERHQAITKLRSGMKKGARQPLRNPSLQRKNDMSQRMEQMSKKKFSKEKQNFPHRFNEMKERFGSR